MSPSTTRNAENVLALIPARGGSKGLPRKNMLMAGDKPLIAWTIAAANESIVVDKVVLSSDDEEILDAAKVWGCEETIRRPERLATDTATSMDVILHALDCFQDFDKIVLLQPTSPLRTGADIDAAFSLFESSGATSCVSVCKVEKSPYWMFRLEDSRYLTKLIQDSPDFFRRQDTPPVFMPNGAIYIARVEWLRRFRTFFGDGCVGHEMPKERSIDIDDIDDFWRFLKIVEA